ncbi:MAG TPA: response regulator [Blastocatellia bacterium]|nr:response regulator [Blastocatellia bacterium]
MRISLEGPAEDPLAPDATCCPADDQPFGEVVVKEEASAEIRDPQLVYTGDMIDIYDHELERLLERVEAATTNEEVLGLDRSDDSDEVRLSYQHAISVLRPSNEAVKINASDEMQARIERAINRVTYAFRAIIGSFDAPSHGSASSEAAAMPASKPSEDNRRRSQRVRLSIPTCVVGYEQEGHDWTEIEETIDVSRTGLTLALNRRVSLGMVLHLTLPLPEELRWYGQVEPNYSTYAIVRRVEPMRNGRRFVGLEFIGENPPKGYFEKPWASFQYTNWSGYERRRNPRETSSDLIWIEYLDEFLHVIRKEVTRTENLSSGGIRVLVKAAPPEFEMVRISYPNSGFESYAVVCNRFSGTDGLHRLCLKFLQRKGYTPSAEASSDREKPAVRTSGSPRRILVADDDPPLRKVLGKLLTQAGYEVLLAEDGLSAVEKVKAERPDLVITDALMPKMHGFSVCKAIKQLEEPPKVIILTAVFTKPKYQHEAKRDYGADEVMSKPFEVSDLLTRISAQLSEMSHAQHV